MSGVSQLLAGTSQAYPVTVDAADFDGTDYMTRGAGFTGAADSKTGIVSAWIRLDGGDAAFLRVIAIATFALHRNSSNKFAVLGYTSGLSNILSIPTSSSYLLGATWYHVLASWDLANAVGHMYINDVSDVGTTVLTNDTIDYTAADWGVGADPDGTELMDGCMSEIYFAPGQYLDFSIIGNRRKFITSGGKPVYLGSNGGLPTGTAPILYSHLGDGETVANFATNRGSGGDLSITGTLVTCSSSPSD